MASSPNTSAGQAGRYACLLYDSTFKVVLVKPSQKELIRRIIELLIPGKRISSLSFIDKEQHGLVVSEKSTTFDMLCKDEASGEEFIVEMQFSEHSTYRDRMLSYATYPIREQLAEKLSRRLAGEPLNKMDYSLRPVYVLSFLNFSLEHEDADALDEENGLISRYAVRNDRNGELMTDALHFVYVEMGRFPYKADEEDKCRTLLEKFVFSLKYMHTLAGQPGSFTEDLLRLLYRATELGSMSITQRESYEKNMRNELDIYVEKSFAQQQGLKEGMEKGLEKGRAEGEAKALLETARRMQASGADSSYIKQMTGIEL